MGKNLITLVIKEIYFKLNLEIEAFLSIRRGRMFNKESFNKAKKDARCSLCGEKVSKYDVVQLGKNYSLIICTSCDKSESYWNSKNEDKMYPKYMREGLDLYKNMEIPQHVFEYMIKQYWVCGIIGQDADKTNWKFGMEMPDNKPDDGYEWRRPNLYEATQRYIWSQKSPQHYSENVNKASWASQSIIPWDEPKASDYHKTKQYRE